MAAAERLHLERPRRRCAFHTLALALLFWSCANPLATFAFKELGPVLATSHSHRFPAQSNRQTSLQQREPSLGRHAWKPALLRTRLGGGRTTRRAVPLVEEFQASQVAKVALSEGFGYKALTEVQAKTMQPILDGGDLLVRARTGAGKTLGFLLPMFERIATVGEPGTVSALVLSPVRELTLQIHKEAATLAQFFDGVEAVPLIGGAPFQEEQDTLVAAAEEATSMVLVATPGRLEDHIASTPGLAARLACLRIVVLDEVDVLAGDFFRPAVQRILGSLPQPSIRQGLFFSATVDDAVRGLASTALRDDYQFVDLVPDEAEAAPERIMQRYAIVDTEDMSKALWRSLQEARTSEGSAGSKVVVILTTARVAEYYAKVFRKTSLSEEIFEVHSRMSQAARLEASEAFRTASTGALFTSDVSARGLDYPGVGEVIQVGAPDSREDYLHRLGRTGRAGRTGRGLLLLHPFERNFLLQALDDQPLEEKSLGGPSDLEAPPDALQEPVEKKVMAEAYYSWLNHKLRNALHLPKVEVVREAARFAACMGALDQEGLPPRITAKNAEKMGLSGIKDAALNVAPAKRESEVSTSYAVVPTDALPKSVLAAVAWALDKGTKVVVFCTSPYMAASLAELSRQALPGETVFEIHSRVNKKVKKKETAQFKQATSGILFAADTSPQALQSPGISQVVQVCLPESEKQHSMQIALASKSDQAGRALLLLPSLEEGFVEGLLGEKAPSAKVDIMPLAPVETIPPLDDEKLRANTYFAWLERYCSERFAAQLQKEDAIKEAKVFAASIGALGPGGLPPQLAPKHAARIGLDGVFHPDLNVAAESG